MYVSYTEIVLTGCILILPVLYETSHVFRYYLKFFIYYGLCIMNSIVLMPALCLKPKNVRNFVTAAAFCKLASPLIGVKWTLRGEEILSQDKSFVIVSNHQSSLDVLGMFDFWHVMGKCTAIAKKELFYVWPFGLSAWLCGLIFIPRLQADKSKKIMNEAAEMVKKDNAKLWVFPEGTRHNDGQIHEFKKGAFHLAINSQLPILPVVFSQYYFLDSTNKRFDRGKVIVTALPPISTEGKTVADIDDLIKETKEKMTSVFHEVNKEVKASIKG